MMNQEFLGTIFRKSFLLLIEVIFFTIHILCLICVYSVNGDRMSIAWYLFSPQAFHGSRSPTLGHTLWDVYKKQEICYRHIPQIVTLDRVLVKDLLFMWVICHLQHILLGYPSTDLDGHFYFSLQTSHIPSKMV